MFFLIKCDYKEYHFYLYFKCVYKREIWFYKAPSVVGSEKGKDPFCSIFNNLTIHLQKVDSMIQTYDLLLT